MFLMIFSMSMLIIISNFAMMRGAWWLSGKFGALSPKGRRFESHSCHHVGTLGKFFTHSCMYRFGVLT